MPMALGAMLLLATRSAFAAPPSCPAGAATRVAQFELNGTAWAACEDLQRRDGALVLVSDAGRQEWFEQGYEPYTQGGDEQYYLNFSKKQVMGAKADILAVALLGPNSPHLTYELVKSAVPPMVSTGVRTFVGSRAASVDTTFSDMGEDANGYGFPSVSSYVVNLTAIAAGEPPIQDIRKHFNQSYVADGMIGGHLPVVRFSFPVSASSPYLPNRTAANAGQRHWDMIAAAAPDMKGSREQTVWFRFQQVVCADGGGACALRGAPQYYDTYWWSSAPDGRTGLTGPQSSAPAELVYHRGRRGWLLAAGLWLRLAGRRLPHLR